MVVVEVVDMVVVVEVDKLELVEDKLELVVDILVMDQQICSWF